MSMIEAIKGTVTVTCNVGGDNFTGGKQQL